MSERTLRFRMVILKVCLLLTLLSIISVAIYAQKDAGGHQNADSDRFTMNARNVTYREVFSEIKRQTGKVVWYDSNFDDTRKINVAFKDAPINDVMNFILKDTGLSWKTRKEAILINGKDIDKSVGAGPKGISNNQPGTSLTDTLNNLIEVTGIVTDEHESPIPGATILLKGTKVGTTTDTKGRFVLENINANGILTISSVSFITKEISINKHSTIGNIQLSKYVGQLDEAVVLAYTKTTNRLLIGNVSKVTSKEIQNSLVSNPILAAAGRIPGIQITQASGFAGGGVNITIQGINTLQNGVAPFYVIDGVPYAQSLLPNLGTILKTSGQGAGDGSVNGNPLSYLNPNDIESIEVLKDADATSIYGSRAANGAIIITTKKGKIGKMNLEADFRTGFGKVSKKLDLLNINQYLLMRKEAKKNDNASIRTSDYDINGTWDSTKNTDWQKFLLGNNSKYTDAQINFRGGTSNVRYLVASSYHKETTVFPTDLSDTKSSVRFNISANSNNSNFQLNLSGSYLWDDNRLPIEDLTRFAMILAPNVPDLKKTDGSLNWAPISTGVSSISQHPLAFLNQRYSNSTNNLISNAVLSYKIIDGLEVKANLGYNKLTTDELSIFPLSAIPPERRPFGIRTTNFGFNKIDSWIIEPQILYNKNFSFGNFNFIAGSSIQQSNKSRKLIIASGFPNDLSMENLSAANEINTLPNSTIISTYKYNAGFIQLTYNRLNKYIINISGRRDGSSRFGSQNRFHNFGAVGMAWIFTEEPFANKFKKTISYGKIKGSYGTTGNDQIGDYNYLSLYQSNNADLPYRDGSSIELTKIHNPYLQWEETRKLSLGLDLGILEDRFLASVVYYRNRSSNMLITAILPATTGPIGGLVANFPALIQNKGLELSFNSTNIRKNNFTWSTNINFTAPQNKLLSFNNLENSIYSSTYVVGQPVNVIKTYHASGVNPTTGRYEFLDKDGKITDSPTSDPLNYNRYINPNPKYYGGINNSFSYKALTLDILFQYVKQQGKNAPYSGNTPGTGRNNQQSDVLNRWKKEGDIAPVQAFTSNNADLSNAFFNQLLSDAYWVDASFLRCKNIVLSYGLPSTWLTKLKLQSCRLSVTGQNIFTITSYKGLDPETQSNFSMPTLRIITFGINVTL